MDIINIPTKYKLKEIKNLDELKKYLPKKFALISLTQYSEYAKKIYEILKKDYEIILKERLYGINVLGCYSEPANINDRYNIINWKWEISCRKYYKKIKEKSNCL